MSVVEKKTNQLKSDIIKNLYYRSPLSLIEISKLTKKSLPLVTTLVNDLIKEKYVIEKGLAPSTGGRRPQVFLLNPQKNKFIISVAMSQMITRIAIYDLSGKKISPETQISLDIYNKNSSVPKLLGFINSTIKNSNIDKANFLGIGISMPGFVDSKNGINQSFLTLKNGGNIKNFLSEELKIPVFIDNDSSLIAFSELKFGAAKDLNNVLVINIGWGTGLGLILNGNLFRGSSGYAGEFSHIPLSKTNLLCSCGKRGCLEVETSLFVMVKNAIKKIEEGHESSLTTLFKDNTKLNVEHFLTAVKEQDPLALSILSDAAFLIGKGIATLIHIINPELIILSGKATCVGNLLLPPIQQAVNEFSIPRIAEQTKIVISNIYHEAELLAAASLVIENNSFSKLN